MIKTRYLSLYPKPRVFDSKLDEVFAQVVETKYGSVQHQRIQKVVINLFQVFLDITNRQIRALDLNRHQDEVIWSFIGFIYAELDVTQDRRAQFSSDFRTMISHVYSEFDLVPPHFPTTAKSRITDVSVHFRTSYSHLRSRDKLCTHHNRRVIWQSELTATRHNGSN